MDLMTILLIGGGLAFLLLIAGIVVSFGEERSLVDDRLGRYVQEEKPKNEGSRFNPMIDWVSESAQRFSWGEGMARELARADLKLRVGEYLGFIIISAFVVGMIAWYMVGRSPFFGFFGLLGGAFLPGLYVRRQQHRRLQRFDEQLADMLNLMVNGLRAGYSTMQAMEAVSRELPAPISDEFRRVVQEMQLGVQMQRALDNLTRRIPSQDLDLVVTAINVQREVGGNLAEILGTISHTIRERVRIKGEIRVLTSQVMYSGRFLGLLPLVLFVLLWIVNRSYMLIYFAEDTRVFGIAALIASSILIVAGYFVMTRIATIDI